MGTLQNLIVKLSPVLPYVLAGVFVSILIILLILLLIFRSAKKDSLPQEPGQEALRDPEDLKQDAPAAPKATLSGLKLRRSFKRALKLLKTNVPGRNYQYKIPWLLMVGEDGSGKTTALQNSGLNLSLGDPVGEGPEVKEACNWWFFERGIVLDIAGDLVLREDGKTADDRLWRLLLRLLQKHRLERPIDGLVLAVPVTDLIYTAGRGEPDLNRVAEKAEYLYKKIWNAQKALGMTFPVYVLITKCDQIEGFPSLCQELPDWFKENIFGWSNPYSIDTAYATDWVDEGFQGIEHDLSQLQYELFTEGTDLRESDGLLLFSENVQSLLEPLRLFMDRLFKQSVYHESFIFRGFYFCGDSGFDTYKAGQIKTFFIKDLFEKKIFPEFKLARPLAKTLISRNRTVLAIQAIALLMLVAGGLGLWSTHKRLKADINDALPVFRKIIGDVDALKKYDTDTPKTKYELIKGKSLFKNEAEHMLNEIGRIKRYDSAFIPSSWFSSIDENNEEALTQAFEKIIFEGMKFQLINKTRQTFRKLESEPERYPRGRELKSVQDLPEFRRLRTFIKDLKSLKRVARQYNLIVEKGTTDLNLFADISRYLFDDIKLHEDFFTDAQTYDEALKDAHGTAFDFARFEWKAQVFTLKKEIRRLNKRLFLDNDIRRSLNKLLKELTVFGKKNRSSIQDRQMIENLLATMAQTEKVIANPAFSWVFTESFFENEPFQELLELIKQLDFLEDKILREIQDKGETNFRLLKREFEQAKTELIGPLLAREEETGVIMPELSSQTLTFKTTLRALLENEFLILEPVHFLETQAGKLARFRWDASVLAEAVNLFKPYDEYIKSIKGELKDFSGRTQTIFTEGARNGLDNKLQSLIYAAKLELFSGGIDARPRETDVSSEIKNFKDAAQNLKQLLGNCEKLGLIKSQRMLSDYLYQQIHSLLKTIDGFLETDNLFAVRQGDFSWWDGGQGLTLAAFEAADDKELENYLQLQRKRVEHLANEYARPLIEFTMDADILQRLNGRQQGRKENLLVFKWERIISAIDKYNNKKPENSITVLEKFILFDMNKINPENYFEKISPQDLNEESGDIFLRRKTHLQRMLFMQCQMLAAKKIFKDYAQINVAFNRQLAGRFPFSSLKQKVVYAEADPEDIRDFYRLYDRYAAAVKNILKINEQFATSGKPALEFLEQMGTVRQLFSSYLDGEKEKGKFPAFTTYIDSEGNEKEKVPVFDFAVVFRVNRKEEIGANRIIDWKLSVAQKEFKYGGAESMGRWRYGDPVHLSLRWAKNSLDYPSFAGEQDGVRIKDRTVEYEFNNQWSLIRFLALHTASAGDFDQLIDPKPHTLKFVIDTVGEGTQIKDAGKSKTRLYIRMIILTPDKKKQVLVMPFFPDQAPELEFAQMDG